MARMEKYEELKISNQFMFRKVMESNQQLCKEMLETIFSKKIERIEYLETEKDMKVSYDSKGIRLDVYLNDSRGTVYNLEMQTQMKDYLPKRSRYYQSNIDIDNLLKGMHYSELEESYVIFICNFDLFSYNRYIYTFENVCKEDMSIRLDDGAYKVFINTKGSVGEITPGLKSLLDFFDGNDPSDDLTRRLEAAVERARNNKEWRADYMVLNAMRMDDKAEGMAEEKRKRIIYALSKGKTIEQIMDFTGYSREEIERVKDEM